VKEENQAEKKEETSEASYEDDLDKGLMIAVNREDLKMVTALLKAKADASYQDDDGRTPLMSAASLGNSDIVSELLMAGAPWNVLDKYNFACGDYAAEKGHNNTYEQLVNHACTAEMLLSHITKRPAENLDYLKQKLVFADNKILDANGDAVMMGWEGPLMRLHAALMCKGEDGKRETGDMLNVGFGLGLIDTYIQQYSPRSHTIIEAHPDVYAQMLKDGWDKKPGVTILFGRWQDVLKDLDQYDGIFFDTYGEHYEDMNDFHKSLLKILRPSGIYTFFNGLAASTNAFFHTVYCRLVEAELMNMEFTCEYVSQDIEKIFSEGKDKDIWEGVKRKYWVLNTYNLPIVKHMDILDCCGDEPAEAEEEVENDSEMKEEEHPGKESSPKKAKLSASE